MASKTVAVWPPHIVCGIIFRAYTTHTSCFSKSQYIIKDQYMLLKVKDFHQISSVDFWNKSISIESLIMSKLNLFSLKNLHKTRGKKTKSILKRIDHKSAFTITALSSWRTICSGAYSFRILSYRYFCIEDTIKAASKINAVSKQWNSVTENNLSLRNLCRRHR